MRPGVLLVHMPGGKMPFPIDLLRGSVEILAVPVDPENGLRCVALEEEDVGFREAWDTLCTGDDDQCLRLLEVAREAMGRWFDVIPDDAIVEVQAA